MGTARSYEVRYRYDKWDPSVSTRLTRRTSARFLLVRCHSLRAGTCSVRLSPSLARGRQLCLTA
jgi:hypothetical protein